MTHTAGAHARPVWRSFVAMFFVGALTAHCTSEGPADSSNTDPKGGGDASSGDGGGGVPSHDGGGVSGDGGVQPGDGGTGTCTPNCASKACGASDGCGAICATGSCTGNRRCVSGSCACDTPSCRGKLFLFGGDDERNSTYFADTWEWDGSLWTKLDVTGPSARRSSAVTFGGKMFLFGGGGELGSVLGGTWEWDGHTWSKLTPATEPTPRDGVAMATLGNKVVLFGGFARSIRYTNETWEWDGTNWTKRDVSGPNPRWRASMSTLGNKIVLFGGYADSTRFDDTWEWDGNTWTKREAFPRPEKRDGHGTSVINGKMMLFGGQVPSGTYSREMWFWNGNTWSRAPETSPLPLGRTLNGGMPVYGDDIMLFGGYRDEVIGDFWQWRDAANPGGAWLRRGANAPSARARAAMAVVPP